MRVHFSTAIKIYKAVISVLLVLLIALFIFGQYIFDSMDETIITYAELVEKQRTGYDELNKSWEESYDSLQTDYAGEILKNHELQQELYNRVELPKYTYSYDEVILLAKVVQCEAGYYSKAPDSQKWVCQVILNRVKAKDFPNTITDVVYQKNQFSVMTDGSFDSCVLEDKTLQNVYEVLLYGTDLPSYVKYFYASYVDTGWVTKLQTYDTVQGTVFAYSSKED